MKQIIFILLFVVGILSAKSQEETRIIQYYFGPTVDTILRMTVDSSLIDIEESESFVLTCSKGDTTVFISLRTYCSSCNLYDSLGNINYWLGYLAKHTNRFYLLEGKKIPIIISGFDDSFGVIKMIDEKKGLFRKSFRLYGEFESQINIKTNLRGDVIYGDVKYIR
jgi:hypothetical protein